MGERKTTRICGFVPSFQHTTFSDASHFDHIPSFPSSSPGSSTDGDQSVEFASSDDDSDIGLAINRTSCWYAKNSMYRTLSRNEIKQIEQQINTENARRYCLSARKRA